MLKLFKGKLPILAPDFPNKWKHQATLLDSVNTVDSTILFHKNKWWLFTNIAEPEGTSINYELCLFYSDNLLCYSWNSHPMKLIISDVRRARPAGKILERNGLLSIKVLFSLVLA
jgi:hypothetical protein